MGDPPWTRRTKRIAARAGVYGALVAACLFTLWPILWALVTSLKEPSQVLAYPPRWVPSPATLANYREVVYGSNMPRYFLNSLVVSGLTVVVTLLFASHGGYAAARFSFPGKAVLLFIILMTVMIPGIAILVPLYMLASRIGLLDTYAVLVLVYSAWQIPTVLWLMRGFFDGVPKDIEEAALIDGCSRLGVFYRIIWPLSRPGMVAAAMVVFVYVWNEFIIAMTLTASDDMRLVPVGLYYYVGAFGTEWGKLMAAVMLAIVPVIVLFLFLQRHLVRGLTAGSTKG